MASKEPTVLKLEEMVDKAKWTAAEVADQETGTALVMLELEAPSYSVARAVFTPAAAVALGEALIQHARSVLRNKS